VKPDTVLLADAGHVRDGLIYVIGGGIEQMYTASLPAIVQATIIARVLLEEEELDKEHTLQLAVRPEAGGDPVAVMQGKFVAKQPANKSAPPAFVTAIKLDGMALPDYGRYILAFAVDDDLMKEFHIVLAKPEALRRRSTDAGAKTSPANPTIRPKARRRKS